MGMFRILISGWRFWPKDDAHVITGRLDSFSMVYADQPLVIVEGACPKGGVDLYAYEWAVSHPEYGSRIFSERHPGIFSGDKFLGPARNSHMVDLGADYLLSFPESRSKQIGGTWDCTRKAISAGYRHIITSHRP